MFQWCLVRIGRRSVDELSKGSMALDEHARIEGDLEDTAEIAHAFGFMFAAAIGEEDKRDMVALEMGEGFGGVGKGGRGAEEDAVDAALTYSQCQRRMGRGVMARNDTLECERERRNFLGLGAEGFERAVILGP